VCDLWCGEMVRGVVRREGVKMTRLMLEVREQVRVSMLSESNVQLSGFYCSF